MPRERAHSGDDQVNPQLKVSHARGSLWLNAGFNEESEATPAFSKDKRRAHRHYRVTVVYRDGEEFARVYTDRAKADKFAERQRKSPVVNTARITEVGG